jgi:hypothetical protein
LSFNTSRPHTEIFRFTNQGNERLGKVENEIREIISMRSLHTKATTTDTKTVGQKSQKPIQEKA